MDNDELRENFRHFDRDKNGKIDLAEFGQLLDTLDPGMSESDKQIGFEAIDADGNRTIEFAEFAAWWAER